MSSLSNKTLGLVSVGIFAFGLLLGRYSVPEQVKKESQTVTQTQSNQAQKAQTDSDRDLHKQIVQTEVIKPDGTKVIVTKTSEEAHSDRKAKVDTVTAESAHSESKQTSEVTRGSSKVTVSFMAGPSFSLTNGLGPLVYGGSITKPVLGPITVGVWGLSNGTGGVSLGFTF